MFTTREIRESFTSGKPLTVLLLVAVVFFGSYEAIASQVWTGQVFKEATMAGLYKAIDAYGAGSEVSLWIPSSATLRPRILGYCLVSSAAGNMIIRSSIGGTVIGVVPSAAGGPCTPVDLRGIGIAAAAPGTQITIDAPGSGTVSGMVWGIEEK